MLSLLFILLVTVHAGAGLQCITDCRLTGIPFGEELRIRASQCQKRVELPFCTVDITLDFDTRQYSAIFGVGAILRESIFISAAIPLNYDFTQQCSTDADCVARDAQKRIDDMIGRSYNATALYGEIGPLITSPSTGDQIQCFDAGSKVVTCAPGELCRFEYDTIGGRVTSRGCVFTDIARVSVFDSPTNAFFDINCKRDSCNGDETYDRIKDILYKNNLVRANGRILDSAGTRSAISLVSIMLSVIFALFHSA